MAWILAGRRIKELRREIKRIEHEKEEEEKIAFGIEEFNHRMREVIEVRKQKILEMLAESDLNSTAVAEKLEISCRTARRYLTELVEERKIIQIASLGPAVRYTLVR